jgi:chromosomal replication initiation ATPase DnaA
MSWTAALPLAGVDDLTASRIRDLAAPIEADTAVSLARMLGAERTARVAGARHRLFAAMWRAGFSLTEIGQLLGRDHSTVISAIRKTVGAEQYKTAQVDRALARARTA